METTTQLEKKPAALFPGEKPKRKQRGGTKPDPGANHRLVIWNQDSQLMIDLRAAVQEMGADKFAAQFHGTGSEKVAKSLAVQGRFPYFVIEAFYAANKKNPLVEKLARVEMPNSGPIQKLIESEKRRREQIVEKFPALRGHLPLKERLKAEGNE